MSASGADRKTPPWSKEYLVAGRRAIVGSRGRHLDSERAVCISALSVAFDSRPPSGDHLQIAAPRHRARHIAKRFNARRS
eukprot:3737189-Alexandrium_andersonii.AAC.1